MGVSPTTQWGCPNPQSGCVHVLTWRELMELGEWTASDDKRVKVFIGGWAMYQVTTPSLLPATTTWAPVMVVVK